MNALLDAMVLSLLYVLFGIKKLVIWFFIRWIWPNPIMIQLCFPNNIADAMVHVISSAFSLHHYHNDYHHHHQLRWSVMLLLILIQIISNARWPRSGLENFKWAKTSCVVGQRTTCPYWFFYLGIFGDISFSQKSFLFRHLAPIYWNWFWSSCARIVLIFLAEPFRSECSPVAWCRRFDASRRGRTWSVIIAPRVITRTLQCNHTCCRCNVITYKHDFSEFVCL